MDNSPLHLLRGLLYLNRSDLDRKLHESNYSQNGSSLFKKEKVGSFFDLSQCRFCELGAIAKLILVIEHHISLGYKVFIALPTLGPTKKEKNSIEFAKKGQKDNILSSRENANGFLHTCGFVTAIQEASENHNNPQVFFTEHYSFESKGFNEKSFETSFSTKFEVKDIENYEYRYLFPFKWFDCRAPLNSFNELGDEFDKILKNPDRGIEAIDVKAIRNVVISELIKNVKEHSGKSYALIAIGLIDINAFKNAYRNHGDIENNYLEWAQENGFISQVEICFGDSGVGILTDEFRKKYPNPKRESTGYSKEQLKLAFQKWTSTKDDNPRRGTKGLYRIQRIVNKYNGIIHIDTSDHRGGFQKGGNVEAIYVYEKTKHDFHGTLINIKLNPYKQIQAFKYKLKSIDSSDRKSWSSDKIVIDESLECLSRIKTKIKTSDNLLLIFDIENFDILNSKNKLEEIFYEISRDSHPCAVVVYFIDNKQLDNDIISDLLDSVNTRIIKDHNKDLFPEIIAENAEDIHDPVLVIGYNNQAFWYGGSKELINVLRESFGNKKNLETLESFHLLDSKLQTKLKLYLENDARLVNLLEGELVYNFQSIDKHYEETIKYETKDFGQKICSPKLQITNYWLNVKEILNKNEYGFALSLYLKFREEVDVEVLSIKDTYLIIDHNQQSKLARAFADLLGIHVRNIKNITTDLNLSIPRRTKLFKPNSNVIVLTTIISSSETARRLVKYAKRDFAIPKIILCLANFRKYQIKSLETWNETTNIISCYQHHQTKHPKEEKNPKYFKNKYDDLRGNNFKTKSPQFEDETDIHSVDIDNDLLNLLTDEKLLHYNHIGVYNKRHFTFYVNKNKLLNLENSIIHDKVNHAIEKWYSLVKKNNLYIYISESIYKRDSSFIKGLEKKPYTSIIRFDKNNNQIVNQANVAYLDFGIMTGESLNSFISNCHNVDNLFVLIVFNQTSTNTSNIYNRIASINNVDPFDNSKDKKATNFSIKYLYDLPLNFYNSENCPICEHQRALNDYKVQNKYLAEFSEDRREKLNLIQDSKISDIKFPVDFYYSDQDKEHELSSGIIKEMYLIKILLENAKEFTSYRIKLFKYIFTIYNNKERLVKDSESSLYALLYYLSNEINWFQIEPLIFRDFRIMISEISHYIACHDRTKLSSLFSKTNNSRTSPEKLTVRYKYAAISVLRSTHKLRFCESIYQIIASSLSDGKFSNNLFQNTLYHVSSLIKNRYNRSEKYYIEIENNLNKVHKLGQLTIPQKMALQKLLLDNSIALKSIREPNPDKEVEKFIKMKRDWENLYVETPRHPKPYQDLKVLNLKKHQRSFNRLENSSIDSNDRLLLEGLISNLTLKWQSFRKIINNDIYYYITSDLPLLTSSDFYNDYYGNHLNLNHFNRNSERFTELVYLISLNPNHYNNFQEEYDRLYNYFENNFAKQQELSSYTENSTFLDLLSQFPSNLSVIIDKVFKDVSFPNRLIEFDSPLNSDNCLVYFPRDLLQINMELVLENLKKRLKNGFELNDVTIRFSIEQESPDKIKLIIAYNGTENTEDEVGHQNGGLSKWKKELKQFGGNLYFEKPTSTNPNFILIIDLLVYERF